jgi:hypothetical protein
MPSRRGSRHEHAKPDTRPRSNRRDDDDDDDRHRPVDDRDDRAVAHHAVHRSQRGVWARARTVTV